MDKLLIGKVALVTGAGRGIGKAIAKLLWECGATIYCNATKIESLQWISITNSDRLIPLPFDIADPEACREAILFIRRNSQRIDVLVNNAGVEYNELIGFIDRNHRDHMFNVNVFAPIELIQLCSRIMRKQNSGSIINIVSKVGLYGNPGQLVYSASKGALVSVTKSAAKELAQYGIRVNAIAPGLTETGMLDKTTLQKLAPRINRIGMGRLADPKDIAGTCLFLASDFSSYVTGQIIEVEGSTIM